MDKKQYVLNLKNKIHSLQNLKKYILSQSVSNKCNNKIPHSVTYCSDKVDIQENTSKICRICYDSEQSDNKLIFPCKCKGTIKYVHEKCLHKWIHISNQNTCPQCKYEYEIHKKIHPFIFIKNSKILKLVSLVVCICLWYLSGKICILLDNFLNIQRFNTNVYLDIDYYYSSLEILIVLSVIIVPVLRYKFPAFKRILERSLEQIYSIDNMFSVLKVYYYIILESLKELGNYILPESEITIIKNYSE